MVEKIKLFFVGVFAKIKAFFAAVAKKVMFWKKDDTPPVA